MAVRRWQVLVVIAAVTLLILSVTSASAVPTTMALPPLAQQPVAVPTSRALDAAADEVRTVDRGFDAQATPLERRVLRERALRAESLARSEVTDREAELARVNVQLTLLGPVTPQLVEPPDIRVRRTELAARRAILDAAIKRGKLISVDADQLVSAIDQRGAQAFSAAMLARTFSPLEPRYWQSVAEHLPLDRARLKQFRAGLAMTIGLAWRGGQG